MDYLKTYDLIRTRILIRNFLIASIIGGLVHYIFKLIFRDPIQFTEILSQAIILGIVFIFLTYNMFKRSEILKKIEKLNTLFPNVNSKVFYGILFSRLENSKYEDMPEKAIAKIHRTFRSLLLKSPDLKSDEVKEILAALNS